MAKTNQKLINYHGSVVAKLKAADLVKGQLAVVHAGQNDSLIATLDNNDALVFFATSGAVHAVKEKLSADTVAVETQVKNEVTRAKGKEEALDARIDELVKLSGKTIEGLQSIAAASVNAYVIASATTKADNHQDVFIGAQVALMADATATGKLADAKDVKDYVDDLSGKTYGVVEAVKTRVATNEANINALKAISADTRLATIEGADAGKSMRKVAADECAKIVSGAPEAFDTLKEIAEWIEKHGQSAATMVVEIEKLKTWSGNAQQELTTVHEEVKTLEKLHAASGTGFQTVAQEVTAGIAAIAEATQTGAQHDVKVTVKTEAGSVKSVAVEAPDFANLYDPKGSAYTAYNSAVTFATAAVDAEEARAKGEEDAIKESATTAYNELKAVSGVAVTALQLVEASANTDYVDIEVTAKNDDPKKQLITVTANVAALTDVTATGKLADAKDVKDYITPFSSATVAKFVAIDTTLGEHNTRIGALEAISGKTESALQGVTATGDTYVTAEFAAKDADKKQKLTVAAQVGLMATVAATGKVADAKDVKDYVDDLSGKTYGVVEALDARIGTIEGSSAYTECVYDVAFSALTAETRTEYNSGAAAKIENHKLTLDLENLVIDCGTFE